ncbi:hypothetical protein IMG5_029940 [Ichthyophthirius multifiliis]|uniref:Uncharacterized protein n=1 Tax=Ichthyophthirius multifiliis TaxID=5932 RepID=G0QLF8_ICHMU|nr:hypothetical protein IMG5_029940 [Ichthyophthirius multifiliis]EGR33952.1 hypothetical protein IMG5_029940 [Ichthyophthirius multifiliis]|eukprot:XP_004039256.1 hypothetical protein IMG5_029940 [Ichthyophthirius multifiliis]
MLYKIKNSHNTIITQEIKKLTSIEYNKTFQTIFKNQNIIKKQTINPEDIQRNLDCLEQQRTQKQIAQQKNKRNSENDDFYTDQEDVEEEETYFCDQKQYQEFLSTTLQQEQFKIKPIKIKQQEIKIKQQEIKMKQQEIQIQQALKIIGQKNHNTIQNKKQLKFDPEIQNILNKLQILDFKDKKQATTISKHQLNVSIQKFIDCIGCKETLQKYIEDIFQVNGVKQLFNQEILISQKQNLINLNDKILENNYNIAFLLEQHLNSSITQDNLNKKQNLQKNYRCLLHSKKPIPCSLWKDNQEMIIEQNIEEIQELILIDESQFLLNLQQYLKKRKFCSACKEHIMLEYQKLKDDIRQNQNQYPQIFNQESRICLNRENHVNLHHYIHNNYLEQTEEFQINNQNNEQNEGENEEENEEDYEEEDEEEEEVKEKKCIYTFT